MHPWSLGPRDILWSSGTNYLIPPLGSACIQQSLLSIVLEILKLLQIFLRTHCHPHGNNWNTLIKTNFPVFCDNQSKLRLHKSNVWGRIFWNVLPVNILSWTKCQLAKEKTTLRKINLYNCHSKRNYLPKSALFMDNLTQILQVCSWQQWENQRETEDGRDGRGHLVRGLATRLCCGSDCVVLCCVV